MIRVYWMETKSEFLKLARLKMYSLSAIGFPLMFYAFFGLAMGREQQPGMAAPMARYLLATYGAFGVMGATLYAFGAGLAVERGLGWLEVKRASPMPPAAYLFAKTAVSLAFGAIIITLLFTMGAAFGGVRMPLWQWLLMGVTLVAGGVPFCALGLAIGTFAGPNSAPGAVNMIYLPMSFCAGLWIPFDYLPSLLQKTAPMLPAFHFSQVALAALRVPVQGSVPGHIAALAGFTLVFGGVAWAGQTREQSKMYG